MAELKNKTLKPVNKLQAIQVQKNHLKRVALKLHKSKLKVRIIEKQSVAEKKIVTGCAKDVYKEFKRQGKATIKWMKDNNIFKKLSDYSKKKYPELYEKAQYTKEDIDFLNRTIRGWSNNVKPEKLQEVLEFWMVRMANLRGNDALKELGINLVFDLKDPEVLNQFKTRGKKITGEITKTTLKQFRNILTESYFTVGLSPYDIEKRIRGLFVETYKNRSMTIARTETGTAGSIAQYTTYKKNGVEKKKWLAFLDAATRDSHTELHSREPIPINEPWTTINGAVLMHPLDPTAEAKEVINCRCDILAVLDEYEVPRDPYYGQAA